MVKQFPPDGLEIGRLEVEWMESMGDLVCPGIVTHLENGYVMEELQAWPEYDRSRLPTLVLTVLKNDVWECRDTNIVENHRFQHSCWEQNLSAIFNVEVPRTIQLDAALKFGCCHGDPSFSNVMQSPADLGLRLIDPCHRDYTPLTWGVDAGKILQSCLGWEMLQADWDPPGYALPDDPLFQDEYCLAIAVWWCGMHAHRIERREVSSGKNRPEVLEWADMVRKECWDAVGL